MASQEQTTFDNKIGILADLWMIYRDEEAWKDFIDFHDLGLPLAFMLDNNLIYRNTITDSPAEELINETFALLLKGLDIPEDTGFESLDDIVIPEMP
jgi:hypothetical protein